VTRWLISRLVQGFVVLLGVSILTFALLHIARGDPARILLGPNATPRAIRYERHLLGLDKPLLQQYIVFVTHAARLDFGQSIFTPGVSVNSLIAPRLRQTLLLALYGMVVSVLIAVPFGIWSAMKRNRLPDHTIRVGSMVALSMPPYWLGLMLVLGLSLRLKWFPSSGYGSGVWGRFVSLTLPAITLGVGLAPVLLRTLRSSLIQTLQAEFIESARSLGFSEKRVILRHALRMSSLSAITIFGANFAALLGAVVVIEIVFVIPGLGALLVQSVVRRDFPVVQALALIFAALVVVANMATDVLYAVVDPRVRR
jgi:peptide/nickel transport system permease protein